MFQGIRIGRVYDIQIHLHWSWILIIVLGLPLLVFRLQALVFPTWDVSVVAFVAIGMLALALGSMLMHQLSHIFVANLERITVSEIVIYSFGGVSDIQRDPVSPEVDAKIAVAGPIASAVLGSMILVAIAALNGSSSYAFVSWQDPDPVLFLLWWTAVLNIFLALLNLLPAAPLDGGRLLQALLWQHWNNFQPAQRWARAIGIVVGLLIMVAALIVAAIGEFDLGTRGLLLVLLGILGWSIKDAAGRYASDAEKNPLTGVHIRDFALSRPPEVSPYLPVYQLVTKYIFGTTNRVFVILYGDTLEGILWLEDVWKVPQEQWRRVLVKHIMTPPERLVVLKPNDSAEHILELLTRRDNRPLPVMEYRRYLGLLRRRNIDEWVNSHQRQAQHNVPTEKARRFIRTFLVKRTRPAESD